MTALTPWRNPRTRTEATVREAIIELVLDDRGFTEGMRRGQNAVNEIIARRAHRARIARERTLGRTYVRDLMDSWRAELGMPLNASKLRQSIPCGCDTCYDGEPEVTPTARPA